MVSVPLCESLRVWNEFPVVVLATYYFFFFFFVATLLVVSFRAATNKRDPGYGSFVALSPIADTKE